MPPYSHRPNAAIYFKGYSFNFAGLACMDEKKNTCKASVGKPKGKSQLGRPGCRWEDNVKINIRGKR